MLRPSRRRSTTRFAVIAGALGVFASVTPTAWAHVTVHSDDSVRGATDVAVSFRTPNEEDNRSTVKLQVFFPLDTPLLGVLVQPHPGWTAVAKTKKLAKPVTTDDGKITEVVAKVTWTANSAADALQPGQSADFVITAGQLPDADTVTFRALQTYSNGDVVRWIDVAAAGAPEPEHPAPELTLASAAEASPSGTPTPGPTTQPSTSAHTESDSDSSAPLVLAIVGLVVAAVALALGLRPRTRA